MLGQGGAEVAAGSDNPGNTSTVLVERGHDIGAVRALTQGQDADGVGILGSAQTSPGAPTTTRLPSVVRVTAAPKRSPASTRPSEKELCSSSWTPVPVAIDVCPPP